MPTRPALTLAGVGLIAAMAAPSAASAAAVAPLKRCYVSVPNAQRQVELVSVSATGFTPGAQLDVAVDGTPTVAGVPVDAAGNANPQVPAPFLASGEREFEISVSERGNAALPAVLATSRVTALRGTFSPLSGSPRRKVRFRGQGFTMARKSIYLHYRFRGKTRRTLKLKPKGPCGTFSARRRLFPFSSVRAGRWTIQLDQQKRYSRTPRSSVVRQAIDVSRRVRNR